MFYLKTKIRKCSGSSSSRRCTYYYIHSYTYEILCTNQTSVFYRDCESPNAFSLTVQLKYLDSGDNLKYNCLINTQNETCSSLCAQLLTTYQVYLVQNNNNQIQTAWTGLSKCNRMPNVKLTHDSTINPCSSSIIISARHEYCFIVVLFMFMYLF